MTSETPVNDPERIVPTVYRQHLANGQDHLDAYRTAVETYRALCPDVDDTGAVKAVSRILKASGILPAWEAPPD